MRHLIQEIHKGKNLKINLERYKDTALSSYGEYAALELTFSAFTMVQEIMEEKQEMAGEERDILQKILSALGELGSGSKKVNAILSLMRELRQEITDKMDVFTCYTDRFLIYEYVLNRMELKYLPEEELNKKLAFFDEKEYMQRLSSWLFSDRDQSILHEKIHLVMGQIPVHMTKSKFSQRVSEAMTLYKDGDKGALENFIYMIRTAAMVYEPAKHVGEYPFFEDILQRLSTADYAAMDEETYQEMLGILEEGARQIRDITDFYYSLQKVVNGIYAMCILQNYRALESRLVKECHLVWSCLSEKEYRDEMLEPLEGQIEDLLEKTSYLEAVLLEIKSSYSRELQDFGLMDFYDDLVIVANLLSDSLFVDLEQAVKEEKADAAYVQKRTEELLAELIQKFSEVSRPVKRAIMGLILEKLPMTFGKTEEVQEYIQVNLLGCQDKAEKCVVMMILWDLMQEER